MTSSSRSLVVGHDGSAGARLALDAAAILAESLSAPVRVIRTWGIDPDPSIAAFIFDESRTRDQITTTLTAQLAEDCAPTAAAHPGLDFSYAAIGGPAAAVLCAESHDERMLVVGSRGLGSFRGLLLGSVSNRCLHLSARPVLVVREHAEHPAPRVSGADEDDVSEVAPVAPGTIVVGYDGSDYAMNALTEALTLAEHEGAPVVVVETWGFDTAPKGAVWKDGYVSSVTEISREVRARLEASIAPLVDAHPAVTVECYAALGHPAEVLVDVSRSAAMLVLGSRGLGGFADLVLGSVSLQCSHRAICPVLVVPPASLPARP